MIDVYGFDVGEMSVYPWQSGSRDGCVMVYCETITAEILAVVRRLAWWVGIGRVTSVMVAREWMSVLVVAIGLRAR